VGRPPVASIRAVPQPVPTARISGGNGPPPGIGARRTQRSSFSALRRTDESVAEWPAAGTQRIRQFSAGSRYGLVVAVTTAPRADEVGPHRTVEDRDAAVAQGRYQPGGSDWHGEHTDRIRDAVRERRQQDCRGDAEPPISRSDRSAFGADLGQQGFVAHAKPSSLPRRRGENP
jgi:hypothetical protein